MRIRHLPTVVVAVLLAGLLIAPSLAQSATGSKEVLVTNTATEAVPVAPQGTTTVTGTVDVGNSPTVNVGNTPTVNVGNIPTVQIASQPLAVTPTVPAQPHIQGFAFEIEDGKSFDRTTVDVPAGKVFVVEGIHMVATPPAGQEFIRVTIDPASGGRVHLPAVQSSSSFFVSQPLKLYLGHDFDVIAVRSATTGSVIPQGSLTGYLVDAA